MAQERILGSAMGLALDSNALWISNKEQVWRFSNVGPRTIKNETWDAVYMPRKGYFIGGCDTHDIAPGVTFQGRGYELAFVNTVYSCIAAIDPHYGFHPIWKPDFTTALSPEDRCHLNGLGTRDGELAYVTLCGRFDTPIGWKAVKIGAGCVMDTVCSVSRSGKPNELGRSESGRSTVIASGAYCRKASLQILVARARKETAAATRCD